MLAVGGRTAAGDGILEGFGCCLVILTYIFRWCHYLCFLLCSSYWFVVVDSSYEHATLFVKPRLICLICIMIFSIEYRRLQERARTQTQKPKTPGICQSLAQIPYARDYQQDLFARKKRRAVQRVIQQGIVVDQQVAFYPAVGGDSHLVALALPTNCYDNFANRS